MKAADEAKKYAEEEADRRHREKLEKIELDLKCEAARLNITVDELKAKQAAEERARKEEEDRQRMEAIIEKRRQEEEVKQQKLKRAQEKRAVAEQKRRKKEEERLARRAERRARGEASDSPREDVGKAGAGEDDDSDSSASGSGESAKERARQAKLAKQRQKTHSLNLDISEQVVEDGMPVTTLTDKNNPLSGYAQAPPKHLVPHRTEHGKKQDVHFPGWRTVEELEQDRSKMDLTAKDILERGMGVMRGGIRTMM